MILTQNKVIGFFQETFEETQDQIIYKLNLTRSDQGKKYDEHLGAFSSLNFEPQRMNLARGLGKAIENIDFTVKKDLVNMQYSGKTKKTTSHALGSKSIFDVFFPYYVKKNLKKLIAEKEYHMNIFGENSENGEFQNKYLKLNLVNKTQSAAEQICFKVEITNDPASVWCFNEKGDLNNITSQNYEVRRTESLNTAENLFYKNFPKLLNK